MSSYEEYLKSDPDKHSIDLTYFPFTDTCPIDGKTCNCRKCKKYYHAKTRSCLMFEMERILWEVFHEVDECDVDRNYITIWRGDIDWNIHSNIKNDHNDIGIARFVVVQSCRNVMIDELICNDVGIKHAWSAIANYRNLHLVRSHLEAIRDGLPLLIATAEKRYMCERCRKIDTFSQLYDGHAVCDSCVLEIVEEYVKR